MKFQTLFVACLALVSVDALAANFTKRDVLPYSNYGGLNSPCRNNRDCGKYGYICKKDTLVCQCSVFYVPDLNTRKCLGGVNEACDYDDDCIEGAFCKNQKTCQCKDVSPNSSQDRLECSMSSSLQPTLAIFPALLIFLWKFQ